MSINYVTQPIAPVADGSPPTTQGILNIDGLLANNFNVLDYGADPTGASDSAAAFSAAWADVKALVIASPLSYVPVSLVIPPGDYKIATSVNWTGGASTYLGWNTFIDAKGAVLRGACADKAMIDMTGVRGVHLEGIALSGSTSSTPSCGILVGPQDSGVCGNNAFKSVKIDGNFTKAAAVNIGSETTTWKDCYFQNYVSSATAYAYAGDGANNLGLTSDYSTLRAANTAVSLTNNSFSGCRFSKLTDGSAIYLERTINWQFHRDNYYLTYGDAGFYVVQTSGTTNRDLSIEGLFETTGMEYAVLIVCTDAQTTNFRRFYLDCGLHFGATAAIGVKRSSDLGDMTSGACNISQATVRVNGSVTGPNTVPLFSGARINYTGDIYCDYGAMMNLGTLTEFHGIAMTDDLATGTAPAGNSTGIVIERSTRNIKVFGLQNFASDVAAAAGSIAVGGLYRNGSVVQVRVS
jgi:hypothetical protein